MLGHGGATMAANLARRVTRAADSIPVPTRACPTRTAARTTGGGPALVRGRGIRRRTTGRSRRTLSLLLRALGRVLAELPRL